MKLKIRSRRLALIATLWLAAMPAFAVNKEIIQLQTQVQQLQEQMTAMQRSFDERMGVMNNLVERDTRCGEQSCRRHHRAADYFAETAG